MKKSDRQYGLSRREVADVLRALALPVESSLYGFVVQQTTAATRETRLETGGGIAGNGGVWWLVTANGQTLGGPFATRRALKRGLLEWQAGPKPDGARYAKRHSNRFGDSVIWVR